MSDDRTFPLRPRDLAVVWGTAFVQVTELWRTAIKAFSEAGWTEAPVEGNRRDRVVVPEESAAAGLRASTLTGESFGEQLPGDAVQFTRGESPRPGSVVMICGVDEARTPPVKGDIYRGTVVDAHGTVVGEIALDAGS
jgi:hypothetical protein